MKIFLMLCLSLFLSLQALAVEESDFSYIDDYGNVQIDYQAYNAAVAAEKVAAAGILMDLDFYWVTNGVGVTYFDIDAFERDYAAIMAIYFPESVIEEPAPEVPEDDLTEDPVEDPVDLPPSEPASDAGSSTEDSAGYPVGSYIDPAGNVFSPDGQLLSPGTTPALDPASSALGLISGEDQVTAPSIYAVSDLRSGDAASGILSGLKALIVSIFGEYTPVMTTMAVTETVDNVTTTTLVDAVAAGAAGVDYEWLSGVALFGIILFCALKLLGGVLK